MDFKDQIKLLSDRVIKMKDNIQTEEATKNALIMPFLQSLGYDVFNPMEVVPEYVTDIGIKKGEKIDYAIFQNGQPTILIECKHWAQNLDLHDGQLLRYFHVSKAKFGILTNGIKYRFYSDLQEPNKMDEKPFFDFEITDLKDVEVEELKKFHKHYFEIDKIVNTASELKFTNEIKTVLKEQLNEPKEHFVRYITSQVYEGRITEKVLAQFTELVKKSCQQVISDIITDRLKNALNKETEATKQEIIEVQNDTKSVSVEENKTETTGEEKEGFFIVKSILRKKIDSNRIVHRDAQSYFAILLDDNNRKPICRLYFNGQKKFIGTFDQEKKETKHEINNLDDIFKYQNELEAVLDTYDKQ